MIIVELLVIDAYLLLVGDVVSLKDSLLVPCTTRPRCLEECFIYIKSIYVKTETGVMINSEATLIGEHLQINMTVSTSTIRSSFRKDKITVGRRLLILENAYI